MTGKHTSDDPPGFQSVPSVEDQRAEVAETVAALAAKADVSSRVQNEASHQAERAKAVTQENPQVVAAVTGLVAALVVAIIVRRRRRRRLTRSLVS